MGLYRTKALVLRVRAPPPQCHTGLQDTAVQGKQQVSCTSDPVLEEGHAADVLCGLKGCCGCQVNVAGKGGLWLCTALASNFLPAVVLQPIVCLRRIHAAGPFLGWPPQEATPSHPQVIVFRPT